MRKELVLDFDIKAQPDEVTCGPTCLHSIYQYFKDGISLPQVIKDIKQLKHGGTLAVILGNHALKRGYKADLYTYNLQVFDPSWFKHTGPEMINFLKQQMEFKKKKKKLLTASKAYINFLESGGEIHYVELDENLIKSYINNSVPLITGLSATYLYGTPREIPEFDIYDSIKGEPSGHFVVITGYDEEKKIVHIADPMDPNPLGKEQVYNVTVTRLINSIMLGIVTFDANLLAIQPKPK
jgi:hypothetical protein